jgi:hypothetical protein
LGFNGVKRPKQSAINKLKPSFVGENRASDFACAREFSSNILDGVTPSQAGD